MSKQILLEKLEKQYLIEKLSRDTYLKDAGRIKDTHIVSVIKEIIVDEINHMHLVKEMIEIVKSTDKPLKEKVRKTSNLIDQLKNKNSVVMSTSIEKHIKGIIALLKQSKGKIIYLSYNKFTSYIKQVMKENKLNPDKMLFINCTNLHNKEDINISPEDLTKIAMAIKSSMTKLNGGLVIVDTISGFTVYHKTTVISKFISDISSYARETNSTILFVSISEGDSLMLSSVNSTFKF